jgi:hypothetical protein
VTSEGRRKKNIQHRTSNIQHRTKRSANRRESPRREHGNDHQNNLPRWVEKYYVPKRAGWHYTRNLDGTISARCFDDSKQSWWTSNARDGWTPNDSFTEWLQVPGVSENQAA